MRRRRLVIGAVVLLLSITICVAKVSNTYARAFDLRSGYGYFREKYDSCGVDVWNGGIQFETGSGKEDAVDSFMGVLESKYGDKESSRRDKVGAAFIFHTMMGHSPGVKVDDITGAQFDELRNRLYAFVQDGGRISRNGSYSPNVVENTYTQDGDNVCPDGRNDPDMNDDDSDLDVAWYNDSLSAAAYVFAKGGDEYYVIKEDCANPLGTLRMIPEAWKVEGNSQVRVKKQGKSSYEQYKTTYNENANPGVTIGDKVQWKHYLENVSPTDSPELDIRYYYRASGLFGDKIIHDYDGFVIDGGDDDTTLTDIEGELPSSSSNPVSINNQDLVGRWLCQHVSFSPASPGDDGDYDSDEACVYVQYKYELTPSLGTLPSYVQDDTTTIENISAKVDNSGPTKSKKARYAVARFVLRDKSTDGSFGGTTTYGNFNGDWPCSIVGSGDVKNTTGGTDHTNCKTLASSSDKEFGAQNNGSGSSTSLDGSPYTDDDLSGLQVGDSLCYIVMVSNYNQNVGDNDFRYIIQCMPVAKRPKVQFWGADVRTDSKVGTSKTTIIDSSLGSRTWGSWAEYGILAGDVVSSASGAGLSATGDGQSGSVITIAHNNLTFANTTPPGLGHFGVASATKIPATFSEKASDADIGDSEISVTVLSSQDRWKKTGNLTITAGEVTKGKTVILNVSGTVTITGDITYEDGYNSVSELPQLVIRARNIVVASDVTAVNAWLIAEEGYVSTCDAVDGTAWLEGIRNDTCDKQLRINGPIVADKLYLRRTYGGQKGEIGTPAEILNLRPDTYLWAQGISQDSGAIKTTYLKELPPRY